MIPVSEAFMLSDRSVINSTMFATVASKGFSRVPIYRSDNRNDIAGKFGFH
jgi:CBS domain containing-hemolysin-like protein